MKRHDKTHARVTARYDWVAAEHALVSPVKELILNGSDSDTPAKKFKYNYALEVRQILGEAIKKARIKSKTPQWAIADSLGITKESMRAIECGTYTANDLLELIGRASFVFMGVFKVELESVDSISD